jgi:hypothetical protein
MRFVSTLSLTDVQVLTEAYLHGKKPTLRRRAHAILLSHMNIPSIRSAKFSLLGVTPSASGSRPGKKTVWRGSLISLARDDR